MLKLNQNGISPARRFFAGAVLTASAMLLTGCGSDETWWNTEWTMRKDITVDTAAAGATELIGGARVLVRLHEANHAFASGKEDGTDIRFIAEDNKTELPFYVEKYDALLNEAHVWVKPEELKPGGKTSFRLYYGNPGPKAVKVDDSKATFDSDTVLSWSFSDKGTAPGDGTSNGNNGDAPYTQVEAGLSGAAVSFTPQSVLAVEPKPTLQWLAGGAMTWSAWIKPGATPVSGNILTREDAGNAFIIAADNGSLVVTVKNGGAAVKSTPGVPLPANRWQHVAVVANGAQVSIYVDGELYGSAGAALPALNSPLFIGAAPQAIPAAPAFVCEMDEMQISKAARSVGWIKFAAAGQGASKDSRVVTTGPDEQGDAGMFAPGSTTAILLSSLTMDGWIVIGILAVMGVISWWIMFTKMRYISGISKGNHAFMNVWKHVVQDLTVLDDIDGAGIKSLGGRISPEGQKAMRQSSVYRIYHIGSEEIRHRKVADAAAFGDRGLSGRSIQAIKASMDGGMVRENQKLTKLIVILTICISGGPFLGLLGTVIGVMITFAAIAAAGDVNVNSIAPGIAAALVATVAGLAVAIPALFGYNYIQSRVKDATTDMHVFIDEFVTRMAEFYPDRRG